MTDSDDDVSVRSSGDDFSTNSGYDYSDDATTADDDGDDDYDNDVFADDTNDDVSIDQFSADDASAD